MTPRIETVGERKMVGLRLTMSLSMNRTRELWQNFMRLRQQIKNQVGSDLYSIQLYDDLYLKRFSPHTTVEKLAAVEVEDFNEVPPEMVSFTLPSGLYAVFLHKGAASTGPATFNYIFLNLKPHTSNNVVIIVVTKNTKVA